MFGSSNSRSDRAIGAFLAMAFIMAALPAGAVAGASRFKKTLGVIFAAAVIGGGAYMLTDKACAENDNVCMQTKLTKDFEKAGYKVEKLDSYKVENDKPVEMVFSVSKEDAILGKQTHKIKATCDKGQCTTAVMPALKKS